MRAAFAFTWLVLLAPFSVLGQADSIGEGNRDFPNQPVKVIVPFGAGGGSDTFARIIQKAIEDLFDLRKCKLDWFRSSTCVLPYLDFNQR